ncbi:uncharacterized protein LOC113272832 [Papaver somniferum]|uniref:uncharacterized protein LOC113272832 n=1 Tax=Papaver somniferum TaxID=3469 RepID=UPI000E7048B5|nr:uncharacterized protein LOC113272832 [Papaver somniferum]
MLNDSNLLSLPDASLYEKEPALDLPLELTQEGREIFQFSLIGRLNFKGLKLNEVQKVLEAQWKLGDRRSKLVPMTKGFFIIKLTTTKDKKHVWHGDTWVVQDQQLRVFNFYPNFDPERQNTSCATVWVSFPGLYIELWTKIILLSIAKILGRPIAIDQKTLDHDVGNYAVVLIDIDFAKPIPKRIRLKANGNEFWKYVEVQDLENIKFCTHCKFMGHKFENCLAARKLLGGSKSVESHKNQIQKSKDGKEVSNTNKKYAWREVRGKTNMHGNLHGSHADHAYQSVELGIAASDSLQTGNENMT